MLTEYLNAALREAKYKELETGEWFSEIPGFDGVWATGETVEDCRRELVEVLEEWLFLKIRDGDPVPPAKGIELTLKQEVAA